MFHLKLNGRMNSAAALSPRSLVRRPRRFGFQAPPGSGLARRLEDPQGPTFQPAPDGSQYLLDRRSFVRLGHFYRLRAKLFGRVFVSRLVGAPGFHPLTEQLDSRFPFRVRPSENP
jgi:hypothetical protein